MCNRVNGGALGTAPRSGHARIGVGIVAMACLWLSTDARAETIGGALAKAYLNNPNINQQRAAVRVADENIPKNYAGYLPQVSASASGGVENAQISGAGPENGDVLSHPRTLGVQFNQQVWNGNKTFNSIRQAESQVFGQREVLRNTEQTVLLSALSDYMNVLRDTAILELDRANVDVLQEQLRQTRDRFNVGEVTRTDVAQAEASLSGAQATALTAQSTLQTDIANYRQDIGDEPKSLAPVSPLTKPIPKTLTEAVAISQAEHPAIVASLHGVDAAELNVKISESALYPTATVTGSITKEYDPFGFTTGTQVLASSLIGSVTIPIYQGGAEYATIRQSKESLGQQETPDRSATRRGARVGGRRLGKQSEFARNCARLEGAGGCGGSRARRRAGGGQGRPADDARRVERAADLAPGARPAGERATRPGGEFLQPFCGYRPPVDHAPGPLRSGI